MFSELVRKFRGALRRLWIVAVGRARIGGRAYRVARSFRDPFARAVASRDRYEAELDEALRIAMLLKSGAVIDVGANCGQTLIKTLEIDPGRRYLGLEPQVSGAASIEGFIAANSLRTHAILPVGLSDFTGLARFGLRCRNDVTASMIAEYRPEGFYAYYYDLPVFVGDDVAAALEIAEVALIKIDVEGGELEVLRGLADCIGGSRPLVLFEVLPHTLLATGEPLDEETRSFRNRKHADIAKLLSGWDYRVFRVDEGGGFSKVPSIVASERLNSNYCAVPGELEADFLRLSAERVG